jgi:hypothetical protein
MKKIFDQIETMKIMADICTPLTMPKAPEHLEDYIYDLKKQEIFVDGYNLHCYYSISDFTTHILKNLQLYSETFSVLPFALTFKIAKLFLGEENLAYLEIKKNISDKDIKVYCWTTVRDKHGKAMPCSAKHTEQIVFRDIEITAVDSKILSDP